MRRSSAAAAVALMIDASVIVSGGSLHAVQLPAQPASTVTPGPSALIGEPTDLVVTFDNNDLTKAGHGPYVDLQFPADATKGIRFSGATYLGTAIAPLLTAACTGALITHPLTGHNVVCIAGRQLVVLQLPIGSFTPTQPVAAIDVTATVPLAADVGVGQTITATPGLAYGDSPTGTVATVGSTASGIVTPQVMLFTKTYLGPESEAATGPNFPCRDRLAVDIANGATVSAWRSPTTCRRRWRSSQSRVRSRRARWATPPRRRCRQASATG